MQNFKQYLSEAVNFAPWQDPNNPDFITPEYDQRYIVGHSTIKKNKNGTYSSVAPNLLVYSLRLKNGKVGIPIKFSSVNTFEMIAPPSITTLQGMPDKIKQRLTLDSTELETLDYLKLDGVREVFIDCPSLKTFGDAQVSAAKVDFTDIGQVKISDIHEHFMISETLTFTLNLIYRKPLLSILKIKGGFKHIYSVMLGSDIMPPEHTREIRSALRIIEKYAKEGHQDIISCQEELLDNGLGDYAKL